jgi:hypothetical protein
MSWRCLSRLAVAGAILAAGTASATPATAAVTYDPATRTGLVGSADVRKAFGWSAAVLATRAGGIAFDHGFWTNDTYSVVCGNRRFPVVHPRVFGRYELADAVIRRSGSRTSTGYGAGVTGFRLTGARAGVSGTSVAPAVGQPCPAAGAVPGSRIKALRLVSTAAGWTLGVSSGAVHRELLTGAGA